MARQAVRGDFFWKGKHYKGSHDPIVSKELFDRVQSTFATANRPRYTKHRHAFAGLLTCGRCGCAITAEMKKGRYLYYHCTGSKGRCGNGYIREEQLAAALGEVVRRVQISSETATQISEALKKSQAEKERFHHKATSRLVDRRDSLQICGPEGRERGSRSSKIRWPNLPNTTEPVATM